MNGSWTAGQLDNKKLVCPGTHFFPMYTVLHRELCGCSGGWGRGEVELRHQCTAPCRADKTAGRAGPLQCASLFCREEQPLGEAWQGSRVPVIVPNVIGMRPRLRPCFVPAARGQDESITPCRAISCSSSLLAHTGLPLCPRLCSRPIFCANHHLLLSHCTCSWLPRSSPFAPLPPACKKRQACR